MRKILIIIALLIVGSCTSVFAQKEITAIDTTMNFENSDFSKVYYFEVTESHEEIQQAVSAKISSGNLTIKVINPMGFRSCGFTLKTDQGARGTTEEVNEDPPTGKWKVKVEAKNCTGIASVQVKLQ